MLQSRVLFPVNSHKKRFRCHRGLLMTARFVPSVISDFNRILPLGDSLHAPLAPPQSQRATCLVAILGKAVS